VEDGGYLVYSTCSIDRSENEDVIEKFLSGNPAFVLADPKSFGTRLPVLEEVTNESGYIRTESLMGKMDGFFIAILKKVAAERIHSA
jgi:16S rRNA (cytosine967-C5)-methyltransferase